MKSGDERSLESCIDGIAVNNDDLAGLNQSAQGAATEPWWVS